MKKILVLLLCAVMFFSFSACSENQAKTVLNISGGPVVEIEGDANADFKDGVLTVSYSETSYLSNVTVDGESVWLTDGSYEIGSCDENTTVEITAKEINSNEQDYSASSVILSIYDSKTNSYSVTWHTPVADSQKAELISSDGNILKTVWVYCDYGNSDYVNRAVFYNLDYNKDYRYTIYNSSGNPVFTSDFKTGEKDPESITFMHISDTQDEDYNGEVWAELMGNVYNHTQ